MASMLSLGCGDDDDTTTGGGNPTSAGMENPAVPTLGAAIDRVGRPAVATATIETFAGDSTVSGPAKDAYNEAGQSAWTGFVPQIAASLGILDALDGACTNQLLIDPAAPAPAGGRYNAFAGVLADDQLYVDSSTGTCSQYLAVELNAVGITSIDDCGGRTLDADVIDITYSAVALGLTSGVTDNVAADDCTHLTEFPYLCAPL